ncbi:hypothetical protein HDC94_002314 [Leifsonia sp. AK011]|uniref:DUF1801 domain-containing protein n=1 Tax=Leifsonia sp. AK011 TaxID=2723075 RepID=UPI0015CE51CE|nr:DUF1801 domain-containing protein [Leifsonia sp. AK011]NYF11158.1 hypothetical protein [Leifsonia sp. AK011]
MPNQFRSIDEFLESLPPEGRREAETLRSLVTSAHPGLTESIKWNSPNYSLGDIDLLTMNVPRSGPLRLILHKGTKVAEDKAAAPQFDGDPDGLLTWHSNIRASVRMSASDSDVIANVIRAWVASAT